MQQQLCGNGKPAKAHCTTSYFHRIQSPNNSSHCTDYAIYECVRRHQASNTILSRSKLRKGHSAAKSGKKGKRNETRDEAREQLGIGAVELRYQCDHGGIGSPGTFSLTTRYNTGYIIITKSINSRISGRLRPHQATDVINYLFN